MNNRLASERGHRIAQLQKKPVVSSPLRGDNGRIGRTGAN